MSVVSVANDDDRSGRVFVGALNCQALLLLSVRVDLVEADAAGFFCEAAT